MSQTQNINGNQKHCTNCNTRLNGPYCSQCGQSEKDYNRPFSFVIYDFAGSVFAFDTRLIKTLKSLLISPGKFANDFVAGKRAKYMPPFQLYVFVSFIFFLTLSISTRKTMRNFTEGENVPLNIESIDSSLFLNNTSDTTPSIALSPGQFNKGTLYQAKRWFENKLISDKSLDKDDRIMYQRILRLLGNPSLFFATVFKFFSWALFILMPVFALLIMLFFNRKDYYYTAHLTFSLNFHALVFITFTVVLVLKLLFRELTPYIPSILLFVLFIHQVTAFKRFYNQKTFKTIIKMIACYFIYSLILLISGMAVIGVAFFNF